MNLDRRLLLQIRFARGWLALAVAAGGLAGVLVIAQAGLLSEIVSRVFLGAETLDDVKSGLIVWLAIAGVRAGLVWAAGIAAFRVAARVKTDLRERLFDHLLALGPAAVRGERTGELANTLTEGVEAVEAYCSQYVPQLVLAGLVPLAIFLVVLPIDPLSGLILLFTGPLIPLFMILIGWAADGLTRRQYKEMSILSAHLLDVLQGLTTLKAFGRSRQQIETIARVGDRFREASMRVLRVAFLSAFALEMIATISTAVVAVQVGLRLLAGQVQFEPAFFVLILAPEFYAPLRALGSRFHAGMSGTAASKRIFEILETPVDGRGPRGEGTVGGERLTVNGEPSTPNSGGRPDRGGAKDAKPGTGTASPVLRPPRVVFQDVHYAYEGRTEALNGASFVIEAGQHVALVGLSGAGKTTLVQLLLGLTAPQRGEILIDGRSSATTDAKAWRDQIAWVPQLPFLFNRSVADNIRLARPDAPFAEVVRAAQLARADEFIRALPHGYDTPVGERGARLSAGQAQRIALARAFFKNAPLLILDEATSSLDVENDEAVQQSVERLLRDRTALVVSHRMNTVRRADRIVLLVDGRVADVGTHDTLMNAHGAYYRMVMAGGEGAVNSEQLTVNSRQSSVISGVGEGRGARGEGKVSSDQLTVNGGTGEGRPLPSGTFGRGLREAKREGPKRNGISGGGRSSWATFGRLVSLAAPFKWWIALAVVLGACTIVSSIGLMATSAYIIAAAALHPSIAELAVPIVGVRFFGIARGAFRYLERCVSHYVNLSLQARLRVWFYTAVEPLAPARLMQSGIRSDDLLNRIVSDVETLQNFYVRVLAPPLVALAIAVFAFLYFSGFSVPLAWAVLGFMLLVGVALPLAARRLGAEAGRQIVGLRSTLTAALVDGIQGMADLMAFGRADDQARTVSATSRRLVRWQGRMASLAAGLDAVGGLATQAAVWSALIIAIPLVAGSRLEGVYLPVLVLAVSASFEGVLGLPVAFEYLDSNLLAGNRLFEIVRPGSRGETLSMRRPAKNDAPPSPAVQVSSPVTDAPVLPAVPDGATSTDVCIRADDLSFRYSAGEPLALSHVDLQVRAGSSLAIVGPSGAGKSTLFNLLMRFWDVDPGHLYLNGRDLMAYVPDEARAFFGVAAQPAHLFNGTLRENLLLARAQATDEEIVDAAKRAQIDQTVSGWPDGYATRIGEQGVRLSGGERQRIAIARALLKRAPIRLLDEPTANLDPLTARRVLRALCELTPRQTVILITHRLDGLEDLDEIVVLFQGRIVERGTHDSLMRRRRAYWRMWELQRKGDLETT